MRNTLLPENGHTFLLKYQCFNIDNFNPSKDIIYLAHADETSTGRACSTFLDSLPNSFFDAPNPSHHGYKSRYTSPLILGVAADLRMYVQRCLQVSDASPLRASVPPLNALAWNVAERGQAIYENVGSSTLTQIINLTQMTEILLAQKTSISNEFGGLTPFESLFLHCFDRFHGEGEAKILPEITLEMISVARVLIGKQCSLSP